MRNLPAEAESEVAVAGGGIEVASVVTVEDEAAETDFEGVVMEVIVVGAAEGRLLSTSPMRTPFPALAARSSQPERLSH